MMRLFRSTKGRKPLLTIKLYKRHVIAFIIFVIVGFIGYGMYFRAFMTLPQSAINLVEEIPVDLNNQKVLIISPHCDDEVLGSGGLVVRALKSNSEVRVVMVTDCNKRKIGETRRQETITGMKTFGVEADKIKFLNFPEGEESSRKSESEKKEMYQALRKEISEYSPTVVILPHPKDTHIDHRASGEAGLRVLKEQKNIKALFYLVHYNFLKFPAPPGFHPEVNILPPARLISFNERWYKFSLSAEEEDLKEESVLKYKSQLRRSNPVLQRILLEFVRKNELFMIEGK